MKGETPVDPTPEKQNQFRARSVSVLAEAKAAATTQQFAEVVRRHSADQASRYRGGDIGWLSLVENGTRGARSSQVFGEANALDAKLAEALGRQS